MRRIKERKETMNIERQCGGGVLRGREAKYKVNKKERKKKNTLVCAHIPSTTSTTIMVPSQSRTAVETSDEKSTWPGESMRLIK